MYQLEIDREQSRMYITLTDRFTEAEALELLDQCERRLEEIAAIRHLLCDFSELEAFDQKARTLYGRIMDLCNGAGIEKVARVFTDPMDTFGMSIMSIFHYDSDVKTRHYDSPERARKHLN